MENTVRKIAWYSFLTLIMVVGIGVVVILKGNNPVVNFGSVETGQGYEATTTASNASGYAIATSPFHIKKAPSTLGSVIVTKAGTAGGYYNFYNATTTSILARASKYASTSILMISLPTDLAAGTYTFDVEFPIGLTVDWSGTIGTTTITYR